MVKMYHGCSMQEQPAKVWLFMIIAILLLGAVIAIRPLERGSQRNSFVSSESFSKAELHISQALSNSEEEAQIIEAEEECEKTVNAEECLNRRALAAHTDYIYTQNHNGP